MDLLQHLQNHPFILAPMAGITDHAFRTFMKEMGAGVVVTELVSATGLKYGSEKTRDLMSIDSSQHPVGIQLFGEDPEVLAEGAKFAQDLGCDFVDLNFGCPVPKVVKKGAGSAMLRDLAQLTRVLRTVKSALAIPLTIKIRTGWDENSKNAQQVLHIAAEEGILWVAIHGRTRAAGYSGQANWDYIAEVKSQAKIPVIGNGDIISSQGAVDRLKGSACDAVMIGRGCLKNPFIFSDAMALWAGESAAPKKRDLWTVFSRLTELVTMHCNERIVQIQLKKFAAWYSAGYAGASQFRKSIFQAQSTPEVLLLAEEFFKGIYISDQQDTSHEAFLMGGHG